MKTMLKWMTVPVAAAVLMLAAPNTSQAESYRSGGRDNRGRDDHRRDDRGRGSNWGPAAAIVAGVAAVGIIAAIAGQHDREYQPAYCPPPPPPRYEPPRQWVPGHYEARRDQVCVPGYWTTVVERPHYGWGGHEFRERREVERVWVPERYEWRETQVWVPGHYELACAD